MDFKVYVDESSFTAYTGDANYNIRDDGVLEAWDRANDRKVTYGPFGWRRIEESIGENFGGFAL